MINSIVEAISCSLNKEFGDDYEIHNEEIKQGLKEPCLLEPKQQPFPWQTV